VVDVFGAAAVLRIAPTHGPAMGLGGVKTDLSALRVLREGIGRREGVPRDGG
jgi:hypothetical protein